MDKLEKLSEWAFQFKDRYPLLKHSAGIIASLYYGALGPQRQKEEEERWDFPPGYWTKWDAIFGPFTKGMISNGGLFGVSLIYKATAGIHEGDYIAIGNVVLGLLQSTFRATMAIKYGKRIPSIGGTSSAIQGTGYRKEIGAEILKWYFQPKQQTQRYWNKTKEGWNYTKELNSMLNHELIRWYFQPKHQAKRYKQEIKLLPERVINALD